MISKAWEEEALRWMHWALGVACLSADDGGVGSAGRPAGAYLRMRFHAQRGSWGAEPWGEPWKLADM